MQFENIMSLLLLKHMVTCEGQWTQEEKAQTET
jgi:hypothetical protein